MQAQTVSFDAQHRDFFFVFARSGQKRTREIVPTVSSKEEIAAEEGSNCRGLAS
jgi:hypothetical protein